MNTPRYMYKPQIEWKWIVFLLLLAAGLVVTGVYFFLNKDEQQIVEIAEVDPQCNIQATPCLARFSGNRQVELNVTPKPIVPVADLKLQVGIDGLDPDAVKVDLAGEGMNMGFNRPELSLVAEDRYTGDAMLSVCTLDRMFWKATVLIYTDDGVLAAPFRFETIRHQAAPDDN